MRTREKVAISIPRDLLDAVERLRKRSGETRSAVFERALADYLAGAQAAGCSRVARRSLQNALTGYAVCSRAKS